MQLLQDSHGLCQRGPDWQSHNASSARSKAPAAPHAKHKLSSHQSDWNSGENHARHPNQKRRACNECKQQKLRCDLAGTQDPTVTSCSRCTKLGLDCRIDEGFRRERKRKRAVELESEVQTLQQQLAAYQNVDTSDALPRTAQMSPRGSLRFESNFTQSAPHCNSVFYGSPKTVSDVITSLETPDLTRTDSMNTDTLSAITTRPHKHEIVPPRTPSSASPVTVPRRLAETELSIREIDQFFAT